AAGQGDAGGVGEGEMTQLGSAGDTSSPLSIPLRPPHGGGTVAGSSLIHRGRRWRPDYSVRVRGDPHTPRWPCPVLPSSILGPRPETSCATYSLAWSPSSS